MEGRQLAYRQRKAAELAAELAELQPVEPAEPALAAGMHSAAEHSPAAEVRHSHFLQDCPAFCREAEACQQIGRAHV